MMDAVFADYRERHSPGATVERDPDLWQHLDELGLVRLTGAEEAGGSGAGWYEAAELLAAAVRHGVRIPLAEHDLLACWLLEAGGLPVDGAARTVCHARQARSAPTACRGPPAPTASWSVWQRAMVSTAPPTSPPRTLTITPGTNLIGEPRDTVAADLAALHGRAGGRRPGRRSSG